MISSCRRIIYLLPAALILIFLVPRAGLTQQSSIFRDMQWRMIGPYRGGRTRAACGVPSEPNVFYVGQVDGGVWRSDDYGRTWKPIFDSEPSQSIGAIAVAPSNPEIIYVASGEGLARPDLSIGDGIYKSTDAGRTWTHLGLRDGQQFPALAVDPHNPDRLFAAVLGHPYGPNQQRGIFRSTDGGATWKKVLYIDENTGGSDVEIDPSNPNVVYATMWEVRQGPWEYNNEYQGTKGGIFKSADGGNTWRKLTEGLPKDLVQAYVAIAPSDPSRLYATVGTTEKGSYKSGEGLGIYRSDDAGEHWFRATKDPRPAERIGGGDLPVPKVDPQNANVVYSASIVTWRSRDGGKTWTGIRGAPGGDDYQNIWINPQNPEIILLVSDQGAIVTVNGGRTWSSWYNQPTAQLYHVQTTNTFPYRVCSGQQESGSVCISSRGNDGEVTARDWHPVGAIEYGYVAPDPLHPGIIYGAGTNEVSKFFVSTGQVQNVTPIPLNSPKIRVDRTQPIIFSPVDPHVLYYAANFVFETADGGETWQTISPDLGRDHPGIPASLGDMAAKDPAAAKQRGVVYALGPSFKSVSTLWAGTDDGLVWITRDGGKKWSNVTPTALTPWSKVTQITASHFDDETAYVSVSRFRIDDLRPYIYCTHDGGKTWQLIVHGLPADSPVDTVREDPMRKELLFAGTETAVWVSFDDGGHWQSLQLNLPHTSMRDLWIHGHDLIVATHGRSFWILDDLTPLERAGETGGYSKDTLVRPETAWRVRRDTNTDTPLPPDVPAGKNPPSGAIIDYFLAHPASGAVTLEILGPGGNLVRKYSSADKLGKTPEEMKEKLQIPVYWVRPPRALSGGAGLHRWVWDLHYPPPASLHFSYPISAVPHDTPLYPVGPAALPGTYTVKLTVDGESFRQPLAVMMDPRVTASHAALERQFSLAMDLSAETHRDYAALMQARALRSQLKKLKSETASPRVAAAIDSLDRKAAALAGEGAADDAEGENLAKLNGELNGLLDVVDGADAAPTAAAVSASKTLHDALEKLIQIWNALEEHDVPALNLTLHENGLPPVSTATEGITGHQ
ncbi:MAG: glycoside hydrolase [Acidobacteriota bacterium]|nr:glycoside hydrolase [Acidobacteriota bacterium]